jgi:hypothetical protein
MSDEQFSALLAALQGTDTTVSALVWIVPLVISLAGAVSWLFQEFYKSRLQREIEIHKATLSENLQRTMGAEASKRQYEDEARRRLYETIGPLRFQLLLACRDAVGRIERFSTKERYTMTLDSYFGRSTVYRILRPIAICDLIEESVAVTDFSVDGDAIDCLRLRRAIQKSFSGDEPIGSMPGSDWSKQVEHVFADRISKAASVLIADRKARQILTYGEFELQMKTDGKNLIAPFDTILLNFSPDEKPLFWVRLSAFAFSLDKYLGQHGPRSGFDHTPLQITSLLSGCNSLEITERIVELTAAAEAVSKTGI